MAKENLISKGKKFVIDATHGIVGGGFVAGTAKLIENSSMGQTLPDAVHTIATYGVVAGLSIAAYEIIVRGLLIDTGVPLFKTPNRRGN